MLRRLLLPQPASARSEPWTFRGQNPGRLESFSDCTFSFALTLLVITLEVPKSYEQLLDTLPGFSSFVACFAVLTSLWHRHVSFFRRYGLRDTATVALNTALLAVVLFFLYPLKFLMNTVFEFFGYALVRAFNSAAKRPDILASGRIMPRALAVYLLGLAAVFLAFALLYRHALRRRADLRLSAFEESETVRDCVLWLIATAAALAAAASCRWMPYEYAPFGSLIIVAIPLTRRLQRRARARARSEP